MQSATSEIYGLLVRQCRMYRRSPDIERARAALDIEQELVRRMEELGIPTVPPPDNSRRRRRRRNDNPTTASTQTEGAAA